jgi:hypothetical protein
VVAVLMSWRWARLAAADRDAAGLTARRAAAPLAA